MNWLQKRAREWLGITADTAAPTTPPRKPLQMSDVLVPERKAQPGDDDFYRRKLTLPKLPKGVTLPAAVERNKMAMDAGVTAFDDGSGGFGFLNSQMPGGIGQFGLYFPGYPYLAELAQRTEYRQPVETVAKEMTRKWIVLKSKGSGDKTKRIEELTQDFEDFKLQAIFRKAIEHDGFYGLGHVFMDFDGATGTDHGVPLEIDKNTIPKGSLRGFLNIEPMWTTPLVWNSTDPTAPNFYKPDSWMVLGRETHQSRMLRFVSREVPDIIKPAYNFGGISLSQLIDPYVARWLRTVGGVNQLINNFSILNLRADLSSLLSGGPSTELTKRMQFFTITRDNQGFFMSDKENEELTQLAVPLSGLSELQAQAQEHMAAPTHLPLVVLTGITPSGLNASSEEEIEVFHDWNHAMQEAVFTDNLKKTLHILQLNRYGDVDDDIVTDFVPLKELVGEAAARVRKMASEAGVAYIDAGVIDASEERQRLMSDPESGYNNLSGTEAPGDDPENAANFGLTPPGGEGNEEQQSDGKGSELESEAA
jgi:phage-related protein (TIGR01555 family)